MIRQAISCDICASEKKQTNHWFVASEQGGELRLSGWSSRNRLRPGMKHLCGQTCLHKLVDEFMARMIDVRLQAGPAEEAVPAPPPLTHVSQFAPSPEFQPADRIPSADRAPSADRIQERVNTDDASHLVAHPEPASPRRLPLRAPTELAAVPPRQPATGFAESEEVPRSISRNWRAEAWDREREREMRAAERRPEVAHRPEIARRRSGS